MIITFIQKNISWLIILGGICYSLYLSFQVPYGTFFNGDCGLKALLAKQLSKGKLIFDLLPSGEKWVNQLWKQGLYPYEKPFVFNLKDRYYISFPFTFSLITAPFYNFLGYRGLYIIPLISTWLIWVNFNLLCQALNFDIFNICIGLIALIFASNLTLYSAMYWEHTLAVSLCFTGLTFFFLPEMSLINTIITGALIGLSVWVRSEFFAMVATLILVVIIQIVSQNNLLLLITNPLNFDWYNLCADSQLSIIYLISIFLVVGAFLIVNKLIYGHFLGIHSLLVIEEFSIAKRIEEFKIIIQFLSKSFLEYFPLVILPILYLILYLIKISPQIYSFNLISIILIVALILINSYQVIKGGLPILKLNLKRWLFPVIISGLWLYLMPKIEVELNHNLVIIYLISFLYIIGVSLLVDIAPDEHKVGGKQWGPRYLLILIPLISFTSVELLQNIQNYSSEIPYYLTLFIVLIMSVLGIYKNIYLGTILLRKNNENIEPTVQFLINNEIPVVAVSHQHAAQALEFSLPSKTALFRVESNQDLLTLAKGLLTENLHQFIYICYPHRPCKIIEEIAENLQFTNGDQLFQLKFNSLGIYGKYPIYQGEIIRY